MNIKERNSALANEIKDFLSDNGLAEDTRIYFNGICYDWDYNVQDYVILEDIASTTYFEYGNDETVSMSFEGALNHLINYGVGSRRVLDQFMEIFERHNCYFELGYAWSLSVYYD